MKRKLTVFGRVDLTSWYLLPTIVVWKNGHFRVSVGLLCFEATISIDPVNVNDKMALTRKRFLLRIGNAMRNMMESDKFVEEYQKPQVWDATAEITFKSENGNVYKTTTHRDFDTEIFL